MRRSTYLPAEKPALKEQMEMWPADGGAAEGEMELKMEEGLGLWSRKRKGKYASWMKGKGVLNRWGEGESCQVGRHVRATSDATSAK